MSPYSYALVKYIIVELSSFLAGLALDHVVQEDLEGHAQGHRIAIAVTKRADIERFTRVAMFFLSFSNVHVLYDIEEETIPVWLIFVNSLYKDFYALTCIT